MVLASATDLTASGATALGTIALAIIAYLAYRSNRDIIAANADAG